MLRYVTGGVVLHVSPHMGCWSWAMKGGRAGCESEKYLMSSL